MVSDEALKKLQEQIAAWPITQRFVVQQLIALAFVGTSGVQLGWLASQADMLADDWVIVGEAVAE